jgi:hypothetical protein
VAGREDPEAATAVAPEAATAVALDPEAVTSAVCRSLARAALAVVAAVEVRAVAAVSGPVVLVALARAALALVVLELAVRPVPGSWRDARRGHEVRWGRVPPDEEELRAWAARWVADTAVEARRTASTSGRVTCWRPMRVSGRMGFRRRLPR